ncbi:MAG: aminotransferase class III-fold pyridoxal phosphate-dependent enzyme [Gemmatimonadetes bacterium]|nr:aminotransferase class III-fold pyridoxal phosphate-dependent enzyme [Gemmatimonadota bacterium]
MIPGFTSTGSKRPDVMFGDQPGVPLRMTRAKGCRVWDSEGREYLDTTMALGAVSLGYGHPAVQEAAVKALEDGVVGPLSPILEQRLADRLSEMIPGLESVRFLKTGAEAVAAAVRIARVHTGREAIVTCGYQGWLDLFSDAAGVPQGVRDARREVPFGDVAALREAVSAEPVAAHRIGSRVSIWRFRFPRWSFLRGYHRTMALIGTARLCRATCKARSRLLRHPRLYFLNRSVPLRSDGRQAQFSWRPSISRT